MRDWRSLVTFGESDTALLGLAGDSAGGNIAAAVVVAGISDGAEIPDRLLLLSAALELSAQAERGEIDDPLNDTTNQEVQYQAIHALYLQGRADPGDPLVSPLRASDAVLALFPPTLLQVSNCELLLWDAQKFAHRLASNAVRVNLSVWPGLPHAWQMFDSLPETAEALTEAAAFLGARR